MVKVQFYRKLVFAGPRVQGLWRQDNIKRKWSRIIKIKNRKLIKR